MNSPHFDAIPEQPLLDVPQIFAALWRRRWRILTSVLVMLAIAVAYLLIARPTYTAQSVLLVDPRETKATSSPNVIGNLGPDSAAIASQVAVISSFEALKGVFEAEKLAVDPEYNRFNPINAVIEFLSGATSSSDDRAALERFMKKVSVEREGLTYILNVNFKSEDPDKAARIANAIVARYITGQVSEKTGASQEITDILNGKIVALRAAVSTAEQAVADFKATHDIVSLDTGGTLLNTQIEQVDAQWLSAQESARTAANRYNQAKAIGATPAGLTRLTEILSSNSAETLRNSYNESVNALARAKTDLGPRHPVRVSLEAEVAQLANLMRAEASRIIEELRAEKELAETNARTIEQQTSDLRRRSDEANKLTVELRQLERNAESSRKVLEQFLERSKETSQLGELQRSDARILSNATPPLKPTWPRPILVLGLAGALGLLIGCLRAILGERQTLMATYAAPSMATPNDRNPAYPGPTTSQYRGPEYVEPQRPTPSTGFTPRQPAEQIMPPIDIDMREHVIQFDHTPWLVDEGTMPSLRLMHQNIRQAFGDQVPDALRRLVVGLMDTPPIRNQSPVCQIVASDNHWDAASVACALALEMQHHAIAPLIVYLDPVVRDEGIGLDAVLAGRSWIESRDLVGSAHGIATINAGRQHPSATSIRWKSRLMQRVFEELAADFDIVLVVDQPLSKAEPQASLEDIVDCQVIVTRTAEDRQMALSLAQGTASDVHLVTLQYSDRPSQADRGDGRRRRENGAGNYETASRAV